jgi:hypothetical protein
MKLIIDGVASCVRVEDAEDLARLSVALRGCSPERGSALLRGIGRLDGDHAWLQIDQLPAIVPTPRSRDWDDRFRQAMAYAAQHGWTDEAGGYVRAHVEPPSAPADQGAQPDQESG